MRQLIMIPVACVLLSFFFHGCDFGNNPETDNFAMSGKLIVAVTVSVDYSAGNVGLYSVENNTTRKNVLSIYSDNGIKIFDTTVYLIERRGKDNVIMIKGGDIFSGTVYNQKNIPNSGNIHDIVFINPYKAYITAYDGQNLICYNPSTGEPTDKTISLAHLATPGANTPNMDRAVFFNGKVYIGLQRFNDSFTAIDSGYVAVVNSKTDSVEKTITLSKKQPQGMYIYEGKLFIACTGTYETIGDGGVVAIDLLTGNYSGVVIEESTLKGNVYDVLILNASKGYVIAADENYSNYLISFNPTTGKVISRIDAGGVPMDFLLDEGKLYIASRHEKEHGIIVLDTQTDTRVSGPHNVGLPPNRIALLKLGE
jgi:outer membrane protein assembly factor BamB